MVVIIATAAQRGVISIAVSSEACYAHSSRRGCQCMRGVHACVREAQVIKAHEERREQRGARLKPLDIGVSLMLITIRRAQLHARRLGS